MNRVETLALCPFCGANEVSQDAWSVKCLECGAEMPGDVDRARTSWNRRAALSAAGAAEPTHRHLKKAFIGGRRRRQKQSASPR